MTQKKKSYNKEIKIQKKVRYEKLFRQDHKYDNKVKLFNKELSILIMFKAKIKIIKLPML